MNKKKLSMMVATVLMAGLVAGMGAMTYSKYITTTTTEKQQATAANWGFVVTVNADNLFGDAYNNADPDNGSVAVKTTHGNGLSVVAQAASNKIVAPGTTGSMTITINGQAEVKAKLTLKQSEGTTLKEIGIKNYNGTAVNYSPLNWTLTEGETEVASGTLAKVLNTLAGTSATLNANTSYTKNYTLTWAWPLETSDTNNIYDTIIGYKSYDKDWDDISKYVGDLDEAEYTSANVLTELAFALDVSIEQIQ